MLTILEVIASLVIGFLLSLFVIPRISLVSIHCRLFDSVDDRKLHTVPIPRLGGIAFFPCITVAISLVIIAHQLLTDHLLLDLYSTTRLLSLLCTLLMVYLMGMMDDLIGVRYRSKFIIQVVCAFILVSGGFCLNNLHGLFGFTTLSPYFSVPFSMLLLVYVMNALNLIDGIDGLASGLSGIALLAFGIMFTVLGWRLYAFLAFAGLGVLLPFFYFNVFGNPQRGRKIFMGDTGSLTIGLLLGALAMTLSMYDLRIEAVFPGSIVMAFSFLIVPMLDVVRVVIHRLRKGHSPFLPDRNHIHHKFILLGMPQRWAMVNIVGIALAFAVANLILIHYLTTTQLFLLDVALWTLLHIALTRHIRKKGIDY